MLTPGGCRIHKGNLPRWQGSGGPASTDGLARQGFPFAGLGICDFGGDGLAKHGFVWDSAVGPVKHCCLWATGDVLESIAVYGILHFAGVGKGLSG